MTALEGDLNRRVGQRRVGSRTANTKDIWENSYGKFCICVCIYANMYMEIYVYIHMKGFNLSYPTEEMLSKNPWVTK